MSRSTCSYEIASLIVSQLLSDSGTSRLSIEDARRRSRRGLVTLKPPAKLKTCTSTDQVLFGFTKECGCRKCKPRRKVAAR